MAGLRYPLGNQRRVISDLALPPEDVLLEPAHALLLEEQDAVLRRRTPLAPPEGDPANPWLVPRNIWRKVEAEAVHRTGGMIATKHDGLDLAMNIRKEADTESAMGQFDDPPRRVFDPGSNLGLWRIENELVNRKFQRALLKPDVGRRPLTRSEAELPVFGGPSIYGGDQAPILMGERAARQQTAADMRRSEGVVGTIGVVRGAAEKLGGAFDGKRFIKYLTVRSAVGMDELTGGSAFGGSISQADARFEEVYKDLPRPVQLVIEEMSPANMAIAVAGGALANTLRAAAPAGRAGIPLRAMASLLEPIKGVGGAAFRPAAGSVLGRIGYEQTEGAPMPIRLATGAAGMLLGARPDAVLSPSSAWARDVWRATKAVPTDVPARSTGTVLSARIIPQVGRTNLTTAGIGAVAGAATGDTWEERRDRALMGGAIGFGAGSALQGMRYHSTFKPPDILDDLYDPAAHGVRFTQPTTNGARFARQDGIDYAADLGQQLGEDVPVGVAHSLQMARAGIRENGQAMERFIGEMPGVRDAYATLFNPSSKIPLNIRQTWFAAGGAMNRLAARMNPSRYYYLDSISKAFGGLDDATKVRPSAAMPATRAAQKGAQVAASEHPHFGKLIDIWAHPTWYDLTDEQVLLMEQFNKRNLESLATVRDFYGVDIGEFDPGNLFVPIVDRKGVKVDASAVGSRLAGVAGRMKERTFLNADARLQDPIFGTTFDPETDFSVLFTELDAAKINAAGNSVMRWGVGGSTTRAGDAFFETQWGTFVPEAHLDALNHFEHDASGLAGGVIRFFDEWRGMRLNADASPLTIQGSMAWAADMFGTAKQVVSAISNGQWNPLDWGNPERLAENMAADPESWLDFAFHAGLAPRNAVPEEFAAGMIGRLPGVGRQIGAINQQLMNLNIYAMKRIWDEDVALLVREGTPLEAAKAAAADTVTKIIPMTAGRKLAFSPARAAVERAAATSISFIRQPIAFTSEAAAGYIKLGMKPAGVASGTVKQWAMLTPHERLAVHRFTRMAGTFMGMATVSAVMTADDRKLSKWEAAQRAITPGTADFMRLWLGPDISVPVGGPYRGLIQAIAPRNGVPFAGLGNYAETRLAPAASTVMQLIRNKDYFENTIIEGDFPENLVRALEFAVEQAVPISVSAPFQAARAGIPQEDATLSVLGNFFGQNPRDIPDYERIQIARRDGFMQLAADPSVERYMDNGLSQVQAEAAVGAQSLQELGQRIGSRAANAVAERSSARFRDDYDSYIDELERRAERGDRDARALLVQVRTQDELDALSRNMRTETAAGPVLDREAYRRGRSDIIMRGIGASAEYEDIFLKMKQSDNEIDQLTGQWYDLIKRAYIPGTKNVDFDVFNAIEAQFFAGMDAQKAELVQANVQTPLRRATAAEEELRQVRRDLEASGFFEVEQEAWEKFRSRPGTGPLAPANFETFIEYRKATVGMLADKLIAKGLSSEHALGVADNKAKGANPIISAYDTVVRAFHAKWAKGNPALAQQAQAWGYLSYSDLNIAASGAIRPQSAAPATSVPKPKSETQTIIELWEKDRLSYGQIAIRLGKTDGAVEQALRRHYEQLYLIKSPVEGRRKSLGQ